MTTLTIDVPEDLALKLAPVQGRITEILELGLRDLLGHQPDYYEDVIDFLASGPSPAEIQALKASPKMQKHIAELLDKNREGVLTTRESAELDRYEQLDYLMTLVKARARRYLATNQ